MTLKKAVAYYPEKTAVVDADQSFTYAQTFERVAALARFFQAQGIRPGDRLAILEVNSHKFLETYYAAAGIGAVLNPLNYRLVPREIAYILRDSGARWLIANKQFAAQVQGVLEEEVPLEGIVWIGRPANSSLRIAAHDYEAAVDSHKGHFEPVPVAEDSIAHLYYTSQRSPRQTHEQSRGYGWFRPSPLA